MRAYSGSGNQTLAEIRLERDAVLHWTVAGARFSLSDATHKLSLSGRGRRGQGFAAAGDYKQVQVRALGKWVLQIQLLNAPK